MAAAFNNPSLFHNINPVSVNCGGKAVGNENNRLVVRGLAHCPVEVIFRNGVKVCRRLIEYNIGTVFVKCTGNGNLLPFTAGKHNALIVKFAKQLCFRAFWELFVKAAVAECLCDTVLVLGLVKGNIFTHIAGKELKILKNSRKAVTVRINRTFPYVLTAHKYPARCGVIKA